MLSTTTKIIFSPVMLSLLLGVLLTACSGSPDKVSKATSSVNKSATNKSTKKKSHFHEGNPCTLAITHEHVGDVDGHEHSYDCENTNEYVSNAHVHPAFKGYKRTRHVHPNGANKHTHRR